MRTSGKRVPRGHRSRACSSSGTDAEQRPLARLAQRGEKERERGLGDARVGGERVRERAEAVALGERRDETVKR